jgi:hypothetical protein
MREVGWIRRARRALEDVEKVITGRTTDVVKTAAAGCFRWSGPPCVAIIPRRSLTTLVAEFRLTLCTRSYVPASRPCTDASAEPWRRWYRWRAACLVTPSCAAISGQPIPRPTARSTRASSSASTASRACRARWSRSKISVEDRWEGSCAEPAVSTVLCCVWLELACLALCVVRRLGLLMPSMMRDSRQCEFPPSRTEACRGLAKGPPRGHTGAVVGRKSAGPRNVMQITFRWHRGRWRSVVDACGLWRTSATARYEVPAFASRRQWSHSRCQSRGGAAQGAGQIGPGHRRSGARHCCVPVGIRARAMRFAASRSPICRDQHLIPESACPHVSSALAARSRCRDGQVLRARRGRREDPVLPNSLLPGRSTTMDKQLRRSSRLPAPDGRPSTNAGSHRRDRR